MCANFFVYPYTACDHIKNTLYIQDVNPNQNGLVFLKCPLPAHQMRKWFGISAGYEEPIGLLH